MMPKIKVLIADDHEMVRQGVTHTLSNQPDFELVPAAKSGRQAVEFAEKYEPDIVLMDVEMPEINGIEASRRIIAFRPETKIIALTGYEVLDYVRDMFRAGAVGFVSKGSEHSEMLRAIRSAIEGRFYVDASLHQMIIRDYLNLLSDIPKPRPVRLTKKEYEIFCLMTEGKTNIEIADNLGMSMDTLWSHQSHIKKKIEV
jgi:two-component system response regulator NreC